MSLALLDRNFCSLLVVWGNSHVALGISLKAALSKCNNAEVCEHGVKVNAILELMTRSLFFVAYIQRSVGKWLWRRTNRDFNNTLSSLWLELSVSICHLSSSFYSARSTMTKSTVATLYFTSAVRWQNALLKLLQLESLNKLPSMYQCSILRLSMNTAILVQRVRFAIVKIKKNVTSWALDSVGQLGRYSFVLSRNV